MWHLGGVLHGPLVAKMLHIKRTMILFIAVGTDGDALRRYLAVAARTCTTGIC